jgi:hypothetical protein
VSGLAFVGVFSPFCGMRAVRGADTIWRPGRTAKRYDGRRHVPHFFSWGSEGAAVTDEDPVADGSWAAGSPAKVNKSRSCR